MNCKDIVKIFVSGFLGGSADVIPGISGGTVYYLLGIYDQLLGSISAMPSLVMSAFRKRSLHHLLTSKEFRFLLILGIGVSTAFFFLTSLIVSLLNSEIYRSSLFALFFGLVIGSFFIIAKPLIHVVFEHISTKSKLIIFSLFALGSIIGFSFDSLSEAFIKKSNAATYSVRVQFPSDSSKALLDKNGENYTAYFKEIRGITVDELQVLVSKGYVLNDQDCMRQSDGKIEPVGQLLKSCETSGFMTFIYPTYFLAGAIACIAMLLPGISGSYMLNVIGMYGPILAHLLTLIDGIKGQHGFSVHFYSLMIVIQVALGILFGGIVFSLCVKSIIEKWPRESHALLSGCLLGSIGILWPFQNMTRFLNPFTIERGYELQVKGYYCPSFGAFLTSHEWFIMLGAFSFLFLLEGIKQLKFKYENRSLYSSSQPCDNS